MDKARILMVSDIRNFDCKMKREIARSIKVIILHNPEAVLPHLYVVGAVAVAAVVVHLVLRPFPPSVVRPLF